MSFGKDEDVLSSTNLDSSKICASAVNSPKSDKILNFDDEKTKFGPFSAGFSNKNQAVLGIQERNFECPQQKILTFL